MSTPEPEGSTSAIALQLRADCANCRGLCCVALPFAASRDFAIDKAAGVPCPNLRADYGCAVHEQLRPAGFPGCASFDCFGAGQHISAVTFAGRDWRDDPATARSMFAAFTTMRRLHELLWHLTDVLDRAAAEPVRPELQAALDETLRLTELPAPELAAHELAEHGREVTALLVQASGLVRAGTRAPRQARKLGRGADLIGAGLRDADLRGADLRGAYLIAADLRGARLALADVCGADFRDADLRGADLNDALFLTQPQLDAARGDAATRFGARLTRPTHWTS